MYFFFIHEHICKRNIPCRGLKVPERRVHLRVMLRPEGISQWRGTMIPLRFEPAAQWMYQLRHRVTPWIYLQALRLNNRYQLIHTVRHSTMTASSILSVVRILSVSLGIVVREFQIPWFPQPWTPSAHKKFTRYRNSFRHWQEMKVKFTYFVTKKCLNFMRKANQETSDQQWCHSSAYF
jgi:hypothetical protein